MDALDAVDGLDGLDRLDGLDGLDGRLFSKLVFGVNVGEFLFVH